PAIGDAVTSSAVLAYIIVSCLSMAAAIGIQTTSPATPGAVHHGTSTLPEDSASESSPSVPHSEDSASESSPSVPHSEDSASESSPSVPHSEDSASESSPSVPHSEESASENTSAGPLPEDSASGRSSSSLLSYSSLPKALFVVGIACLLFSDLLIAQRRFLSDSTLYFLMMPTYFASQLLATHSLLLHTTKTNIQVS
ncbi:MAG: hypothetical protein K6C30_02960, partial [Bacteroidaceae bacterium]|nr:hypothetical protein [Bacteroidaceae bacterium]